jgi:hypothetical protein
VWNDKDMISLLVWNAILPLILLSTSKQNAATQARASP